MSSRLIALLAPTVVLLTTASAHAQFGRGMFGGTPNNGYGFGVSGPQLYGGFGSGTGLLGYGRYGYGGWDYGLPYYSGYGPIEMGAYPSGTRGYGLTYSSTPTYSGIGYISYLSGYPYLNTPLPTAPIASTVSAPATVTLVVPNGAQVWFDGKESGATGTSRVFTSPTLQPGQSSVLSVKATWDGRTREMQLPIRAGDKLSVDLSPF